MSEQVIIENVIKQLRSEADKEEVDWISCAKIRVADKLEKSIKNIMFGFSIPVDPIIDQKIDEHFAKKSIKTNKVSYSSLSKQKQLDTLIRTRISDPDTRLELMHATEKGFVDPIVLEEILNIWLGHYEVRPVKRD